MSLHTHANIYQKRNIIALQTHYSSYTPVLRPHVSHLPEYQTVLDGTILPEMPWPLAEWVHIAAGHMWVTVLTDWAYGHGVIVTLALMVADNCSLCSQTKLWKSPKWGHVQKQQTLFQMAAHLIYCCLPLLKLVSVQTYYWYLHWTPAVYSLQNATSHQEIFLTRYVLIPFDPPNIIDSYQGTHFTFQVVQNMESYEFPPGLPAPRGWT